MRRRAFTRSLKKLASVALDLLFVVALVVGLARGGSSYFACPAMESISSEPCCDHCTLDASDDAPAVESTPCCSREHVRALPSATAAAGIDVPVAPLLASIDPVAFAIRAPTPPAIARARARSRAAPPPRDTSPPRSMVFRL